jgi:hypothetical protein
VKVKIFLSLTIILFLFTGWQISRNFTMKKEQLAAQKVLVQKEAASSIASEKYSKASEKEFKIEGGIEGGVSGGMEGGEAGGTISLAEIELQKQILKAEEAKRKAEERAEQRASLQLWLSFAGTLFSGITTIVLARINKK